MSKSKLKKLGDEIRLVRLKKRWTQTELAKKVGMSQSTISAWERGEKEPTYLAFCQVCKKLGIKELPY